MKKKKELENIINIHLPALFKKYFLPKISEIELKKIIPKLDSEIENLLRKYPSERKKAMSISSGMFFTVIGNLMHENNPDAFWFDKYGHKLLKGRYEQEAKDYALQLFSHYFYDYINEESRISFSMFLCGMLDHPFTPSSISCIDKYALTDDVILIQGETGTGKELLARTIHYLSNRRTKPFISVNSGGLNEGTLLSELFGHVKGAFTGADRDKKGAFELADGGTLFLDEVGDMPSKAQVSLLRALDDKKIQKVGDIGKDIYVDVRIIAATNKNLREGIREGIFREDLFYRLDVFPIQLLSIREYPKEQIESIIWKILAKVAKDIQPEDIVKTISGKNLHHIPDIKKILPISQDALDALKNYSFPGNYRKLGNIIKNAFIKSKKKIELEHLPGEVRNYGIQANQEIPANTLLNLPYWEFIKKLDDLHKKKIEMSLQDNKGDISKTARSLIIKRYKLDRTIKRFGIKVEDYKKD